MPRQSSDARAAAAFTHGGAPPPPPSKLSKEAKAVWVAIVSSKPNDWFDDGSLVLLEIMVKEVVAAEEIEAEREVARKLKARTIEDHARKCRMLKNIEQRLFTARSGIKTSAVKLRLTVQAAVHWANRKNGERGVGRPMKREKDDLLGGNAWNDGKVN